MTKIIGITSDLFPYSIAPLLQLDSGYVEAVIKYRAVPLMLPLLRDFSCIYELVSLLDGLIFSGGLDISPWHYGKNPIEESLDFSPLRDKMELLLFQEAGKQNVPILAIGRGMQLMNVALGGSLVQDIRKETNSSIVHHRLDMNQETRHFVNLEKGSHLWKAFQQERAVVTSMHHQCIDRLADSLRVTARSDDGIIEGVEGKEGCLIGLQFHPERDIDEKASRQIFQMFVDRIGDRS